MIVMTIDNINGVDYSHDDFVDDDDDDDETSPLPCKSSFHSGPGSGQANRPYTKHFTVRGK